MEQILEGTFEKPFYKYLHIDRMGSDGIYTNLMHSHFCLEIIYAFSGQGYVKTETGKIPLKQGDLLFINRGSVHTEYTSIEDRLCFYSLQMSGVSLEENNSFYLVDFLSDESKNRIDRIFQIVYEEEKSRGASYLNMITYLLDAFLLILARENINLITNEKSSAYVKKADDYIKERIFEKITLDDLAREVCLNKYSLIKKFKEECGVTPVRYIMEQKIRMACNLISFSDYTIEEISDKLGFCSVSHFYQVFKRVEGSLPTHLRQKKGKNG